MKKKEKELAVCQMATLHAVLSSDGLTIQQAIKELSLDNQECFELAQREGFDWIASEIKKSITN